MINKNTDIRYIKGIGEKRAELFNKLGVFCVGDLLRYLPRGYEDRTDMRDICDIEEGESVCIKGSLAGGIRSFRAKTGARVIQTRVSDGTGIINLTWFNAPYVEKVLKYFFKKDKLIKFENNDLKQYETFKKILLEFQKAYNIEEYNLKDLDRYLWQLGKHYFPNKYYS